MHSWRLLLMCKLVIMCACTETYTYVLLVHTHALASTCFVNLSCVRDTDSKCCALTSAAPVQTQYLQASCLQEPKCTATSSVIQVVNGFCRDTCFSSICACMHLHWCVCTSARHRHAIKLDDIPSEQHALCFLSHTDCAVSTVGFVLKWPIVLSQK